MSPGVTVTQALTLIVTTCNSHLHLVYCLLYVCAFGYAAVCATRLPPPDCGDFCFNDNGERIPVCTFLARRKLAVIVACNMSPPSIVQAATLILKTRQSLIYCLLYLSGFYCAVAGGHNYHHPTVTVMCVMAGLSGTDFSM